ncbi:hypothetical protein FNH82_26245 [Salmonella enterica subsp. diarizonae]|nr:hypothetical protein [Salmonella enterica subsp. diarizonae]
MRIVKATKAQRWNKVRVLQRLLTRSHQAKLLAVKRVTLNRGRRDCKRNCGATRGCSCDCFSQYVVRSAKKPAVSPAVPYPTVR